MHFLSIGQIICVTLGKEQSPYTAMLDRALSSVPLHEILKYRNAVKEGLLGGQMFPS